MDIRRVMNEFCIDDGPTYVDCEPLDITNMVRPYPSVILVEDDYGYNALIKFVNDDGDDEYMCLYLSSDSAELCKIHRDNSWDTSIEYVTVYSELIKYIRDVHYGDIGLSTAQTIANEVKLAIDENRMYDCDSIIHGIASKAIGKSARGK